MERRLTSQAPLLAKNNSADDSEGEPFGGRISFDDAGSGIGVEDDDKALQAMGDDSNPMVRVVIALVLPRRLTLNLPTT